jgi:hypothetical protein
MSRAKWRIQTEDVWGLGAEMRKRLKRISCVSSWSWVTLVTKYIRMIKCWKMRWAGRATRMSRWKIVELFIVTYESREHSKYLDVHEWIILKWILNEKEKDFGRIVGLRMTAAAGFFMKGNELLVKQSILPASRGRFSSVELISWLTLIAYSRETVGWFSYHS